MPCVFPAQCTGQGVETAKALGELAKPYFCTQAGLTESDCCCVTLL